ncbi:universal stress protein [Natronomonas salina]|uniref:universal stress protein n=1 Tax=Natronomonas salina TaxID=1710540 RepID=UPI0015B7761A|nr:universal stress protein [Natronomonas salina]QLD89595.1 universal stress protein [Natronomonas salina]
MLEDILIPTDGSDEAGIAIDHGLDLAARFDATAHVLHVVNVRQTQTAPHSEECEQDGETYVTTVADRAADQGIAVEQCVRTGYPEDCILSYADDHGVDLVAMGTHGRTGVRRYVLGSVAERVVRLADVPVLTVRLGESRTRFFPYEDVLVPTDGSDGAMAAAEWAVGVADAYDATVHALSVVDATSLGLDVRSVGRADDLDDAARSAIDDVTTMAREAGLSATGTVATGTPYREIRSYVDEYGTDLTVIGRRGKAELERYLVGGVADRTLRTSHVPVVTVKHPDDG